MKHNRKPVGGYIMALLFAGLAVSCSKEQFPEPAITTPNAADLQIKTIDEGNYHGEIVPLELAKLVAQKTEFQQLYGGIDSTKGAKGARVATRAKVIRGAVSLRDKHNQPALHVINYENGGFVVLSAERSAQPVLAFSDTDQFQTTQLPNGVKEWVEDNQKAMELIRTQSATARSARKASDNSVTGMQWDNVLAMTGLIRRSSNPNARAMGPIDGPICHTCPPEPNPDPCDKFTLADWRGPYTKTTWDQSSDDPIPYNWLTPNGALAGCGPVAMAQLMAFFRYPSSYRRLVNNNTITIDWSTLPLASSSLYSAIVLRDAGDYAHSTWGGLGQETSTNLEDIAKALKNNFGYKHVTYYESYKYSDLFMALNGGIPVIMRGKAYDKGHIWVCDGYKIVQSNCATSTTYYWHMNWGWGGDSNGYYSDSNRLLDEQTNQGGPGREEYKGGVFNGSRRMIVARP